MGLEDILLLISSGNFTIFLGLIVLFYGVQKSISDSFYTLKKHGIKDIWFSIGIVSFAFPIFFSSESAYGLLQIAAGLICFVAAASAFKERKQTKIVHYVAAIGGILFGMASLIVDYGSWELVVFAAVSSLFIRLFVKNYFWWIEILSFITILLGRHLH